MTLFMIVAENGKDLNVTWAAMSLLIPDAYGVLMLLLMPLATGRPVVVFPPRAPLPPIVPTSQNTLELAKDLGCTGMVTKAAFLQVSMG